MSINSIEKPHILFKYFNLKDYSNIYKKPIESIKVCYLVSNIKTKLFFYCILFLMIKKNRINRYLGSS